MKITEKIDLERQRQSQTHFIPFLELLLNEESMIDIFGENFNELIIPSQSIIGSGWFLVFEEDRKLYKCLLDISKQFDHYRLLSAKGDFYIKITGKNSSCFKKNIRFLNSQLAADIPEDEKEEYRKEFDKNLFVLNHPSVRLKRLFH